MGLAPSRSRENLGESGCKGACPIFFTASHRREPLNTDGRKSGIFSFRRTNHCKQIRSNRTFLRKSSCSLDIGGYIG
jgi:hypothetical protein